MTRHAATKWWMRIARLLFDVTFYLYGDVVSGWDVAVADKASTNKK